MHTATLPPTKKDPKTLYFASLDNKLFLELSHDPATDQEFTDDYLADLITGNGRTKPMMVGRELLESFGASFETLNR